MPKPYAGPVTVFEATFEDEQCPCRGALSGRCTRLGSKAGMYCDGCAQSMCRGRHAWEVVTIEPSHVGTVHPIVIVGAPEVHEVDLQFMLDVMAGRSEASECDDSRELAEEIRAELWSLRKIQAAAIHLVSGRGGVRELEAAIREAGKPSLPPAPLSERMKADRLALKELLLKNEKGSGDLGTLARFIGHEEEVAALEAKIAVLRDSGRLL